MLDWLPPDRQEWFVLTLFPLAAALTGWLSVAAARRFMYFPLRPLGKPPWLGWQGIIPQLQHELTHTLDKVLRRDLITLPQLYELLGPEKTISQVLGGIRPQLDTLIDDIMLQHNAVLWENLPVTVKNRYYSRAHKMIPRIIDDIVEEMGDNIDRLLDLPDTLKRSFDQHPEQLNTLYQQLTRAELYRLSWSAALTQFMLATLLGYAWLFIPEPLLLATGLTLSGLLTAWIWQQARLRPARARIIAPSSHADLNQFLVRVSESLLSPWSIAHALIAGNKSRHSHLLIKRHVNTVLDDVSLRTFSQLAMGPEGFAGIKHGFAERIPELYLEALIDTRFNAQRCKALAEHLQHQASFDAAVHYGTLTESFFTRFHRIWLLMLVSFSALLSLLATFWV